MKLVEIRELSIDELSGQIKKSNLELVDLRMKFASRQLEDPSKIRKKRKEIARLLTVQTQKNNGKITEKDESESQKESKQQALKESTGKIKKELKSAKKVQAKKKDERKKKTKESKGKE